MDLRDRTGISFSARLTSWHTPVGCFRKAVGSGAHVTVVADAARLQSLTALSGRCLLPTLYRTVWRMPGRTCCAAHRWFWPVSWNR